METYWEKLYAEQGSLWDFYPSDSALVALELFQKEGLKKLLIPGIGYGRNAKPFINEGFEVSGIEISKSAIELAKKNYPDLKIHHGTLTGMPFDTTLYDCIFSYATLHLFNQEERAQIVKSCYMQLKKDGLMFFNVVSVDSMLGFSGVQLDKNLMKLDNGLELTFYDITRIENEFKLFNLIEIRSIAEPIKFIKNQKPLHCFNVICRKNT